MLKLKDLVRACGYTLTDAIGPDGEVLDDSAITDGYVRFFVGELESVADTEDPKYGAINLLNDLLTDINHMVEGLESLPDD